MARPEKQTILEQLKLEVGVIKDGGYGRSVRTPWLPTNRFRDSVVCLNFGEKEKRHPCSECFLINYVPEAHKGEEIPCHFIPLNEQGETVHSLESKGDTEALEESLLGWLETTIKHLEKKEEAER